MTLQSTTLLLTCFSDREFKGEVEEVRVTVFHAELGEDRVNQLAACGGVGYSHCLVLHILHQASNPHTHGCLKNGREKGWF